MCAELTWKGGPEWDLITLEHLTTEDCIGEAELYLTKWFDYRRMHPMQATFEFIVQYSNEHRHQVARRLDVHTARGLNLDVMKKGGSHLPKFWAARRIADRMGVRYDEYCAYACDVAERCWKHLARPSDLTNSFLVESVQERWVEMLLGKIIYPRDEFYEVGNWRDHPDQQAWQTFVQAQVETRQTDTALKWNGKLGSRGWIRQCEPHGAA